MSFDSSATKSIMCTNVCIKQRHHQPEHGIDVLGLLNRLLQGLYFGSGFSLAVLFDRPSGPEHEHGFVLLGQAACQLAYWTYW